MPSPKAVLRDITDQGLHPGKAHRRCGTDGRLAGGAAPAADPVKLALKQLAPEKSKPELKHEKKPEPAKVEPPKVEEKAPEVHVEAEVKPVEPPKAVEEKKEEAAPVKTEAAPEVADDGKKKPAAKKADKPAS